MYNMLGKLIVWLVTAVPAPQKPLVVHSIIRSVNYSVIYSGNFYSVSSSPLLLRSAPNTARILYRNFTPKRHGKLWVKDLPKVPTWRLERESNPWLFGRKASTLPMRHTRPTRQGRTDENYWKPFTVVRPVCPYVRMSVHVAWWMLITLC